MYYISKLLLYGTRVNNLQIKDYANDYDLSTMEIYLTDTKTGVTNKVAYRDLKGDEFGVVGNQIFSVSENLWKFLDYADKPNLILEENSDKGLFNAISDCTSIRNIGLNEYMIKDRHVIIFSISSDCKPVDENFIFWSKNSKLDLPVSSYIDTFTLFELYEIAFESYSSITSETELYYKYGKSKTACCRLFLNKDIIRYFTKLITLRG